MKGVYTALATPFDGAGEVDLAALDRILEQQRRLGVRGFVACGTTGESSTLSRSERESVFRRVLAFAGKHGLDAVAGTGTNDTRETIELTRAAEAIGYRRFLVVTPYYNKPSQAGLRRHYEAVGDACSGEIVLYNVPGRTGVSFTAATIAELAAHPRIRALKEATGKIDFLKEIQAALAVAGRSMALFSGDDATYLSFLEAGGTGVISVASHVCPSAMIAMESAFAKGDRVGARKIRDRFLPLMDALFFESNPGPLKWFLKRLGLAENALRLPLVPVSEETERRLEKALAAYPVREGEVVA